MEKNCSGYSWEYQQVRDPVAHCVNAGAQQHDHEGAKGEVRAYLGDSQF
jgi:hypothetical protein